MSRSDLPLPTPGTSAWPAGWGELAECLPQGLVLVARSGEVRAANGAGRAMLRLESEPLAAVNLLDARWGTLDPEGRPLGSAEYPFIRALAEGRAQAPRRLGWVRPDGDTQWMEVAALPLVGDLALVTLEEVTEHHLTESVLAAYRRISELAASAAGTRDILRATLDEAERLTGSCIGFYHFVDADQDTLTLQAWSTRTAQVFCKAEGAGMHYPVHQAGVWADALRTGAAVIHNDYPSLPHRKGMPEGHAEVRREAVVTVQRGGRIVAILGVGNKPFDYGARDLDLVQRLADLAWDLVARKRAEEARSLSEQRFRLISEHASDMVYTYRLHPEPGFEFVSPSAFNLTGYTPEDFYADPNLGVRLVHPEDQPLVYANLENPGSAPASIRLRYIRKDGRVIWTHQANSFLQDAHGRVVAVQGIVRDVTSEVEAHKALQKAYDHLGMAQQAAGVGLWDWDLKTGRLTWSRELFHIYGLDPDVDQADYATWQRVVHPEDREPAEARTGDVLAGKVDVPSEYRVRWPDGTVRWVRVRGALVRNEAGEAIRMAGVCIDISREKAMAEQLATSEARAASMLRTALDGIWLVDPEGRFLDVNEAACRMLGFSREDMLAMRIDEVEALESQADMEAHIAILNEQGAHRFESRHRTKDGHTFPVEVSATYQPDLQGMVAFVRDITDRKAGEQALRETTIQARRSTELLQAIFESPKGVIIFALDHAFRYTAFTTSHREAMKAIWGVEIQVGSDMLQAIGRADDRAKARGNFERALAGEAFTLEEEYGEPGRQRSWWENRYAPIRDSAGAILGITVFVIDVTERRRSEAALQESEARLRRVVMDSPYPVMVHAEDGEIIQVSRSWMEITGFGPETFGDIGTWLAAGHRDRADQVRARIQAFFTEGLQRRETDYAIWTRSGEVREWRVCTVPVGHLADGRLIVTTMATDMTERNRALAELAASETRAKSMLRTSLDGVWLIDAEGRILEANEAVCTNLGYSRAELLGRQVKDIEAVESPEEVRAHVDQVRTQGSALFVAHHRRKDGSTFPVEVSTTYLPDLGQFVAYLRDITARQAAEHALRESERRFRTTLNQMAEGCAIFDRDLTYRFVNSVGASQVGRSPEALLGRRFLEVFADLDRSDFHRRAQECLRTGIAQVFESEFPAPEGTPRCFQLHLYPAPEGLFLLSQDITEQRRAEEERRQLQAHVERAQKMDSLGNLAGGIAHDMNNVMGAIMGLASLHEAHAPAGSQLHTALHTITKACERGRTLVQALLGFARQGLAEEKVLDLNALVRDQATLLSRTTLQKVQVDLDLQEPLPAIRGDVSALSHVILNLAVNAVDAMAPGGRLTLRTRSTDLDWVLLEVVDTGSGMTPDVLARATDPFFTTKPQGQGTGLGLALAYNTVKAHGGRLDIQSEVGVGTTIGILLPTSSLRDLEAEGNLRAEGSVRRLSVLVVDDDELIQVSLKGLLQGLGHGHRVVGSGEAALQLLAEGVRPEVVILDLNMPGLGGEATLQRIRTQNPDLPVLLATGRVTPHVAELVRTTPHLALLPKPFTLRELGRQLDILVHGLNP